MREPGDAADHDHREHQRAAGEQPHGDRAVCRACAAGDAASAARGTTRRRAAHARNYPTQPLCARPRLCRMHAMKRRLTAWLTILAMLAGSAWPAHAGHLASARGPMSDLCSAVKPAHSTPAAPATAHADECAKCCACSGGAAAAALIGSTLTAARRYHAVRRVGRAAAARPARPRARARTSRLRLTFAGPRMAGSTRDAGMAASASRIRSVRTCRTESSSRASCSRSRPHRRTPQVMVTDAWVRGTVPGQNATGAFMQLDEQCRHDARRRGDARRQSRRDPHHGARKAA